ncbi:hypothetical protein Glove_187g22 [Diversispora epigaea]|uniref:TLDc domain-containing protein n=1 Tax=Diversispora epigaea TaxID=1348612 RepID=A0A397ILU0_9GLOM|nr:hypothetical protein Glove_187g22 [Diversispora epigaea]
MSFNFYDRLSTDFSGILESGTDYNVIIEVGEAPSNKRFKTHSPIYNPEWDHVIRWGKAQHSNLPTDLNDWNDNDFLILKNTLHQCIPLIRYFTISETNFVIIAGEHSLEIASWIDKKNSPYANENPYKFQLIIRGSRVKNTDEIFGGYKNVKNDFKNNDAFIFSLKTEKQVSILSQARTGYITVCDYNDKVGFCGLYLTGNFNAEKKFYLYHDGFEKSISYSYNSDEKISVEEYELFKVVKKSVEEFSVSEISEILDHPKSTEQDLTTTIPKFYEIKITKENRNKTPNGITEDLNIILQ